MKHETYFYNCSKEYLDSIEPNLFREISEVIFLLPKRSTQTEINNDLFWLLTSRGWSYDTRSGISESPPADKKIDLSSIPPNNRNLCLTLPGTAILPR
jgi:hypothetical protein